MNSDALKLLDWKSLHGSSKACKAPFKGTFKLSKSGRREDFWCAIASEICREILMSLVRKIAELVVRSNGRPESAFNSWVAGSKASRTPGSYIGAILGPSLAILVGYVEASRLWKVMLNLYVRCCSVMLLDLCPKAPGPRFWVDFGKLCLIHLQDFRPRLEPSLAILGPIEASEATTPSCGKDKGSWGQAGPSEGHVEAKLVFWKLLCHVEAICQILFGHVIGFASRNAFPPRFWLGFCELCWLQGSSTAILWLCWKCWHHLGINLGHLGGHDDAMWVQFGGYNSSIIKSHPKLYLQNAHPQSSRGVTE